MWVEDYIDRLSLEARYCPARAVCPLAFMCASRRPDGKLLLPAFEDLGRENLVWTDLTTRPRVYAVRDGVFVSKVYVNAGAEQPYGLAGRGFLAGLPELYSTMKGSSFYFFKCLVPGRLCRFEATDVKECFAALSVDDVQGITITSSLNWTTGGYSHLLTLAHKSMRERVASVLARISLATGVWESFALDLPITHADVAFMAAAERATVSRELKAMADEGLVELGYRLIRLTPRFLDRYGTSIEACLPFYTFQPKDGFDRGATA